jgi:hypothetical protein
MTLKWTDPLRVNSNGCGLWANGTYDVISASSINQNDITSGSWQKSGSGTGFETGDTVYGLCDGNVSTVLTSPYGGDSVLKIMVMIRGYINSDVGTNTYEIQLGKEGTWNTGTMNSYPLTHDSDQNMNILYGTNTTVEEWGVTGADVEAIIEAASRSNQMSFNFRPTFQSSTSTRKVYAYSVDLYFREDTLYEPPTGTGIILGGSF